MAACIQVNEHLLKLVKEMEILYSRDWFTDSSQGDGDVQILVKQMEMYRLETEIFKF